MHRRNKTHLESHILCLRSRVIIQFQFGTGVFNLCHGLEKWSRIEGIVCYPEPVLWFRKRTQDVTQTGHRSFFGLFVGDMAALSVTGGHHAGNDAQCT